MAVVGTRVSVTPAGPVALADGNDYDGALGVAKNKTGTASVFLGGANVTAASGFEWTVTDGPLNLSLKATEILYGVLASGAPAQEVHVLASSE